ncbi:MAG: hypothetical protein QX196_15400 [Methylococcaceae bacterium]
MAAFCVAFHGTMRTSEHFGVVPGANVVAVSFAVLLPSHCAAVAAAEVAPMLPSLVVS